MIKTTAANVIQ